MQCSYLLLFSRITELLPAQKTSSQSPDLINVIAQIHHFQRHKGAFRIVDAVTIKDQEFIPRQCGKYHLSLHRAPSWIIIDVDSPLYMFGIVGAIFSSIDYYYLLPLVYQLL